MVGQLTEQHNMKTIIKTELTKIITAEDGKVLTNGGEFEQYPIELTVDINDNSWYEIDEIIEPEIQTI